MTVGRHVFDIHDPMRAAALADGSGDTVLAPMPGKVVRLSARAGDSVEQGQVLAVLEAMKMEHSLKAPRDGTVAEILAAEGDQVSQGDALVRLEDE